MLVEKCDACNKTIPDRQSGVHVRDGYTNFEFCKKCAAPVLAVLKRYKLAV